MIVGNGGQLLFVNDRMIDEAGNQRIAVWDGVKSTIGIDHVIDHFTRIAPGKTYNKKLPRLCLIRREIITRVRIVYDVEKTNAGGCGEVLITAKGLAVSANRIVKNTMIVRLPCASQREIAGIGCCRVIEFGYFGQGMDSFGGTNLFVVFGHRWFLFMD